MSVQRLAKAMALSAVLALIPSSCICERNFREELPYEAALTARFRKWERLHEDGFYKVVMAQGPKRDGAGR